MMESVTTASNITVPTLISPSKSPSKPRLTLTPPRCTTTSTTTPPLTREIDAKSPSTAETSSPLPYMPSVLMSKQSSLSTLYSTLWGTATPETKKSSSFDEEDSSNKKRKSRKKHSCEELLEIFKELPTDEISDAIIKKRFKDIKREMRNRGLVTDLGFHQISREMVANKMIDVIEREKR